MTDDELAVAETRDQVIEEVVRFVRQLRAAGVNVPADGGLAAARALGTVGLSTEDRVRAALHAALVSSEGGREPFDRLFDEFWLRLRAVLEGAVRPAGGSSGDVPDDVFAPLGGEAGGHSGEYAQPTPERSPLSDDDEGDTRASMQPRETALDRRVTSEAPVVDEQEADGEGTAAYSPAGAAQPLTLSTTALLGEASLPDAVDALGDALSLLRGRRWRPEGDRRPDVRRALRTSVSAGGTLLPVPERDRVRAATRATVLVDVSQSVLDTIDRGFLIRFLRLVTNRWRQVRVFFFDTAVREVTAELDAPTAGAALAALEDAEAAWGGGTRIGAAFDTIRREHREAIDRRTAVVVISDGLEVGDIDTLEDGAAWLGDRAASVLWLNPLAVDTEYEPTVRGMAAALPHVDGLFAFTEPGDVGEMARQLRLHGPGGRIGYRYDPRRAARA